MARGRKRRNVRRQPNGQPYRAPKWDKGCDGVVRRRLIYGASAPEQSFDAIGRAFCAGLLGRRSEAKRDGARKIAAQYVLVYGTETRMTPDSLSRFQPDNSGAPIDPDIEKIRRDALDDALEAVLKRGRDVRNAFDDLVLAVHPDSGPLWLDRIIFARMAKRTPREDDTYRLMLAIQGLEVLT